MGTRKSQIARTAIVHSTAKIGSNTKIWEFVQIGEHAQIGRECVVGNGAYIDRYVRVGNRVRIHNKALLYHGLVVKDDVFIGPGVCFTNDAWPKSGYARNLKGIYWTVEKGASIGANATILPNVTIGAHAMVGAGSVVTKNVPARALVCGNPARIQRYLAENTPSRKRTTKE